MAFDIYGGVLRRGYCEVHPDVPEEYPCHLCVARERQPEPDPVYLCDICHLLGACASVNGRAVCSEECANEALKREEPKP